MGLQDDIAGLGDVLLSARATNAVRTTIARIGWIIIVRFDYFPAGPMYSRAITRLSK